MRYLADTHIVLRRNEVGAKRLDRRYGRIFERATPANRLLVSEISLWEIAVLHDLKRIDIRRPLRDWLLELSEQPMFEFVGITPAIAAATAELPPTFHRDPGDRILVATARTLGATLLTEDETIIRSKVCLTL